MTDPLGLAIMLGIADMAEIEAHLNGAIRRQMAARTMADRWRWAYRVSAVLCAATCAVYLVALAVRYPIGYGWYTAAPILGFAAFEHAAWRERCHLRASIAAGKEIDRLLATLPRSTP